MQQAAFCLELSDKGSKRPFSLFSNCVFQEEYVLAHMPGIMAALRQGNVSLRWLLLQSCSRQRKLKAAVESAIPTESERLNLLLQIAQLERQVSSWKCPLHSFAIAT